MGRIIAFCSILVEISKLLQLPVFAILPIIQIDMLRSAENSYPEQRLDLRFLRGLNRVFTRAYHRVEIINPANLPDHGPAILICNHVSGLDPAILQSATSRLIVWMMAKEYYEIPQIKWFFKRVEAIPVNRSGRDMSAMRAAMRAIDDGRIIGIFPEGKIEPDRELLKFQTGAAVLAMKTGVDIYPAYLTGTQRKQEMLQAISIPQRTRLSFGAAIRFNDP